MTRDRWVIEIHLFHWHLVIYVRDWEFWTSKRPRMSAKCQVGVRKL